MVFAFDGFAIVAVAGCKVFFLILCNRLPVGATGHAHRVEHVFLHVRIVSLFGNILQYQLEMVMPPPEYSDFKPGSYMERTAGELAGFSRQVFAEWLEYCRRVHSRRNHVR